MIDIKALSEVLSLNDPKDLSSQLSQYAAVAVIIRIAPEGKALIGYIKRATQLGDKWSGHVAFPGGKYEAQDLSSIDTAVRETFEEIGVVLHPESHLGRLADIQARNQSGMLPFYIRPHVFVLYEEPDVKLDTNEVASFDWVDLLWLLEPTNRKAYLHSTPEGTRELPAFTMPDQSTLWGLTYMITMELLDLLRSYELLSLPKT